MIDFQVQPGWKVLELGGGANRHPKSTCNVDVRKVDGVDFEVDFNKPEWPEIGSNEFDVVLSIFCLEHISWRNTGAFLKQAFRVLKPGGFALFVVPNTEAQMKYILSKADWDGDEGSMLFGDLNYKENAHQAAFSPKSITKAFAEAGFVDIVVSPFGQPLQTDMVVEAKKPIPPAPPPPQPAQPSFWSSPSTPPATPPATQAPSLTLGPPILSEAGISTPARNELNQLLAQVPATIPTTAAKNTTPPAELFNRLYFEKYPGGGFYWGYPYNEPLAQHILSKRPQSVLELGCARGYVLKKLEDAGIPAKGIDVSKHAYYTRVCDCIYRHDLLETPWPIGDKAVDFVYSVCLLEHIPEDHVPTFMAELNRVGTRGFHLITIEGGETNEDKTRCTKKPLAWWQERLPNGHQAVDAREIGSLQLTEEYVNGDGKLKVNLGCAWTQFYGYENLDSIDAGQFANTFRYKFIRHDMAKGLPYPTGVVDLLFMHHVLEHFTYDEGIRLLRECRRVIRPEGAIRLAVPDTASLACSYANETWTEGHSILDLKEYDEINEGCAKAPALAGKLWGMLGEGHKAFIDFDTLSYMLREAGWVPHQAFFRKTSVPAVQQILRETIEMPYGDSSGSTLFMDATPALG